MVQCYYKNSDQLIRTINSGLCSGSGSAAGYYSCCFPWDECLPNGLCSSNNQTSYYTSLCTDQTLEDSACQRACNGVYLTNLTYNTSTSSWACCDADTDCSTSFNETFDAPSPEALLQQTMTIYDFIPTSTITSASASSATGSAALAGATTSARDSSVTNPPDTAVTDSSLSTGAKAGIGIGVAVAILLIVGAIAMILRRKSNRQRTDTKLPESGYEKPEIEGNPVHNYAGKLPEQYHVTELANPPPRSELSSGSGGGSRPQELSV